jgi:DNA-binding NarL/FixJ family response regulator
MTTPVITVLIADDHPIFRAGLRQAIEASPGVRVVAEAGDGDEALAGIESAAPALAILDIDMPGRDGLEVARELRDRRSATRVILLTMHKDAWFLEAALDAGVHGYVPKDSAASEIAGAIRSVHTGQAYISPQLSSLLINRRRRAETLVSELPALDTLTPAEVRVLKQARRRGHADERDRAGVGHQSAYRRSPSRQHRAEARSQGHTRPGPIRGQAPGVAAQHRVVARGAPARSRVGSFTYTNCAPLPMCSTHTFWDDGVFLFISTQFR